MLGEQKETIPVELPTQFDRLSNFRDIGGFKTEDGRRMKAGLLFRSAELSRMSGNDLKKLHLLNLKVVCDLRTPGERKSRPDRIPFNDRIRMVNIPMHQNIEAGRRKILRFLVGKSGGTGLEAFVKNYYHGLAFGHTEQIKEIATLISDERNLPALIHCNAGKDRTGFVSALIQLLAGVPKETVIEDYLLTNRMYRPRTKRFLKYIGWLSLFKVSPGRLKLILEARSDYLGDVLDEILQTYGTIEGYLSQACGVDQSSISNLKHLLVE